MSNHWLPREPAFGSFEGDVPIFEEANAATADWLKEATGITGRVSRLTTAAKHPYGHFRVIGPSRAAFLKVLPAEELQQHQFADRLSAAAFAAGAAVLPPAEWMLTPRGPVIGIYSYVPARYCNAGQNDMSQLGRALALLHCAWRNTSLDRQVEAASAERMRMLSVRHAEIIAGSGPLGPDPAELQALALSIGEPFAIPANGQIVHGDLNRGNVLFDNDTAAPTFIDFETAAVSWLPPMVDLVMIVQRICCDGVHRLEDAVPSVAAFLEAYLAEAGHQTLRSVQELSSGIRWICLRNLCLLAEVESRGGYVAEDEWRKFLAAANDSSATALHLSAAFKC
ncbi:phosphotransferase [Pelagibius sp.]|uniref:phosphotransferase n=1 Tax=Pelagibius sp. TaxID=1931238 RepID=UPI003B50113A